MFEIVESEMRESREGGLRMDQRKGERPDLWLMRAFLKALPYMDINEARAAAAWMYDKVHDPKTWRGAKS